MRRILMETVAGIGQYLAWFMPPLIVAAATLFVFRPGSRGLYQQRARVPFEDEEIHRRTLRRVNRRF
jgi:hypothetical protein